MGLDARRFASSVDEEFRCPTCKDIIENPISSHCEHIFCRICIENWLKNKEICPVDRNPLNVSQLCEPSRFFRNLYTKLLIKCEFELNGCKDKCKIEELNNHQNKCKFNPVVKSECEGGCDAMLTIEESKKHNCVQYLKAIILRYKIQLENVNAVVKEQGKNMEELKRNFFGQSSSLRNCTLELKKVTAEKSEQSDSIMVLKTTISEKCVQIDDLIQEIKRTIQGEFSAERSVSDDLIQERTIQGESSAERSVSDDLNQERTILESSDIINIEDIDLIFDDDDDDDDDDFYS